ncbi:MAG: hypothetical protein FWG55_01430 [Candidatus Bathyarchaeota archaeon]|nr:hypothetical protein [Candidatus Termiticorpusculum sp.]
MRQIVAQIPHGFQTGHAWINQVQIRELTGYDEQLIASTQNFFPPFKTSLLLARVIKEFNNQPPTQQLDPLETIRNLPVGDRIALILHLRKITFGPILHCTIQCPNCADNLSIDFPIDSILQPPQTNPQTTYHLKLEDYSLQIRPITGADLENITLNQNTPNLQEKLLRYCILTSDPPLPEILNTQLQEQLSTKLSEIDQQADLTLNINCHACNKTFQTPLDIEDFFFQEVTSRCRQLEREIHWIALHYHWTEKDILALPSSKRKRYVELINTSLSGESI